MSLTGRTFGPYRVIATLGAGAMGKVYSALDTRLDRQVVLKVLSNLSDRNDLRDRFVREARVVANLNHPHICALYDIGHQEGIDFLVLEHLEGQTLASRLAKGRLPVNDIINFSLDISDALREAHSKRFIHRDIKPANIFITISGSVKILDFGLATLAATPRRADNTDSTLELRNEMLVSHSGLIVGTIAYMSPEQVSGEILDPRTDLFSFGVVLYEMTTGVLPFNGKTVPAVFDQILRETPRSVHDFNSEVPPALVQIIRKALEKDRAARYQSALEFHADLKMLKQHLESGLGSSVFTHLKQSGPQTAIAVLPFINRTASADNEYFTDGLTEDLINGLARAQGLRVASRTSTFAFKGKDLDVREIGRKLNVDCVLEGSVRKSGRRLRITVQLINVVDGYELWSERYDLETEDEFTVQDQITEAIVTKLKIRFRDNAALTTKRHTQSHEAYHLYLKARYYWNKMTEDGYRKGFAYAEQAIANDPNYALAYAGLADAYSFLGINGVAAPAFVFPKATWASKKALELDSSLAEAHASLALSKFWHEWDWAGADAEFQQALELNPNYVDVHGTYAWFLTLMGRHQEALAFARRGQQLDPLSLTMNVFAAWMLAYTGEVDAALEEIGKVFEMDMNFSHAYLMKGETLLRLERYDDAVKSLEKAVAIGGQSNIVEAMLGHAYGIAGDRAKGMAILSELKQRSEREFVGPLHIALVHLGLDERDQAIQYIEKAYAERDAYIVFLNRHPIYNRLRSDQRFQAILEKLKFPSP